ncbi:hypothetical protein [Candidatus Methylomicrobium oryzae]|uniref:hypothetical protein n=1 Tax=Candidatus Methylomicrobium oryzae TaxID=2802053 RepID=UPI0019239DCF|nr:hypothetical protein [Methylomicrobium sp. RS1]MBL1263894.1 hypothetical protein [Methylomicrobium sp. RS1]
MKTKRSTAAKNSPPLDSPFPSARYFQIHFQYLQEIIGDLRVQVEKANRQIAELQVQLHLQQSAYNPSQNDYGKETENYFERRVIEDRQ